MTDVEEFPDRKAKKNEESIFDLLFRLFTFSIGRDLHHVKYFESAKCKRKWLKLNG